MKAKRFFGDKAFYKSVFTLVLPLIIQQGITNFVNLLDNVMVGGIGTEAISGVAIVNQLIFVFNLTIFGAHSGACIYGAQYAGVKDYDGVRYTFRFKLILGTIISAVAITLFAVFGDTLISLYLNDASNTPEALAATLVEAKSYLAVMLFGLFPFMLSQGYASSLRETGETFHPMIASVISIVVNLVLNWLLIYGKLGFPCLGVKGAAIATVISRYVELAYLLIRSHRNTEKYKFVKGALRSAYIPKEITKKIIKTGTPLLANELLWSVAMALVNQAYSVRGLNVVAATNITSTVWNLFCVIMFSMGTAISIMVGQRLGAGDMEGAKETDTRLITLSLLLHVLIGIIIILLAPYIPNIYKTEPEVRSLATGFLQMAGIVLPLHAFSHATYFTIRSGGRTFITFLFDSVFTWLVTLPTAYLLCNYTSLEPVLIYLIVQCGDVIKLCIGLPMLRSGMWARNVISGVRTSEVTEATEA